MMRTLRQECVTCPCRIKVKRQPKKDIFGITLIALKLKNIFHQKKKLLVLIKEHYLPAGKVESGKLQHCVKGN